jgi:hypothetical protein
MADHKRFSLATDVKVCSWGVTPDHRRDPPAALTQWPLRAPPPMELGPFKFPMRRRYRRLFVQLHVARKEYDAAGC